MALSQSAVSELLEAFRTGEGVGLIRESVRLDGAGDCRTGRSMTRARRMCGRARYQTRMRERPEVSVATGPAG
jgi:hypothetical protein